MQISLDRSFCLRLLFSNVLLYFDWLSLFVSFLLFLSGAFLDWSMNSDPYLMFVLACSERMLITYFLSYTFSVVAFLSGFLLIKSISFRLLPAMCCIATSKCASRSNHLISLAPFFFSMVQYGLVVCV